jgi:hypothetical protein
MIKILYETISKYLFGIFVAIFIVYTGVFAYWLLWPYEPVRVNSITIENPGKIVKAGDVLIYKICYEKLMPVSGKLVRKLINDTKIDLRDSDVTAPIGKDKECIQVRIPKYATPGKYSLWWSASYKVNPLRTVTVSKESEPFEVVK